MFWSEAKETCWGEILRDHRFRVPGLVISINWNCGILIFLKKVGALMIEGWPRTKKIREIHSLCFYFRIFFNVIAYRHCRQTRQLSLCFVCTDSHTWSLRILLYLPFNLGLFTHGLNIAPLQSGHLPIKKKSAIRAVEVIDRGEKHPVIFHSRLSSLWSLAHKDQVALISHLGVMTRHCVRR